MSEGRTYLDFNATTPLCAAARQAIAAAHDLPGNASSVHAEGRAAREVIETARSRVAALIGAQAKNVIFTSGGTEAANLALTPHIGTSTDRRRIDRLLVLATEHPCVLNGHRFPTDRVTTVPVIGDGRVDMPALDRLLAVHAGTKIMLAIQAANNETGVIQPVAEVSARIHARDGLVVCDGVQAASKVDCRVAALGADMVVLSAHKFGGPKGAGALVVGADLHIEAPLLRGGGQERGLRAGTENVAAIAGFGAAALAVQVDVATEAARLQRLRDAIETAVRATAPDAWVFGEGAPRLPNTTAFAVPGVSAETLLIALDLGGVAVSSGSACSSGKVKRSHVLDAMGIAPDRSSGAIRVSLGRTSTANDVGRFADVFATVVKRIRGRKVKSAA